jgi:Uma2 family endonuclease
VQHRRRADDMVGPSAPLLTEEQFFALRGTPLRTELLDGELVREPDPGEAHAEIVHTLGELLRRWAATVSPAPDVSAAPVEVRFGPGRILLPDLLVFLDPLARPSVTPITRIPDLCIEVVSTRRAYARVTKRLIYAAAGVKELWTVLPLLGFVERWTAPALGTRDECRGVLRSPLLPGFELDVALLLANEGDTWPG